MIELKLELEVVVNWDGNVLVIMKKKKKKNINKDLKLQHGIITYGIHY